MKQFLFRAKYRFDLGTSFLSIINLALVAIAAGDKIYSLTKIPTKDIVVMLVPATLMLVWLFGFILDKYMKMGELYTRETNNRNEMLCEVLERIKEVEKAIKK